MIVLDTQVLFWWLSETRRELTRNAREAIEAEENGGEILVSSMSAWEIALLVAARRLTLSVDVADWLAAAAAIDVVRFVPLDNTIAVASINLPGVLHRDPADRIIAATARHFQAPLVTKDARLLAYPHVVTIW
jgi:PIN domain nuclease of toxin-antitoxin system